MAYSFDAIQVDETTITFLHATIRKWPRQLNLVMRVFDVGHNPFAGALAKGLFL